MTDKTGCACKKDFHKVSGEFLFYSAGTALMFSMIWRRKNKTRGSIPRVRKLRKIWSLFQRIRMQGNVLFAGSLLLVVGLHPVFPMLAGRAILAAELEPRDVYVAHLALVWRIGREILHPRGRQRSTGVPVEDVRINFLTALERDAHIAAIVECLLERAAYFFIAGHGRNPALKLLVLGARSQFKRFNLLACVLQNFSRHARVSSSARSDFSICTSEAGPCGAG